jgi:CO/xanthine dehydrogenase Mo-binding subunit
VVDRESRQAFEDSFEFGELHDTAGVNRSVVRVDGVGKVLGTAKYTQDYHNDFPNLLHARLLRSPHAHARIVSIDTSRAEALPGVRLVVTGKDDIPRVFAMGEICCSPAEDEVLWVGQTVAAVVAESAETALEALELIDVVYEVLPAVLDIQEAMKPDPVAVVDKNMGKYPGASLTPVAPNIAGSYKLRHGDVAAGFAEADVVLEDTYYASRISHAQLEEVACVARYETNGGLTMWTNVCGVHPAKALICGMLGLAESKVRLIQAAQGGSFGNRLAATVEPLAALLALRVKGTVEITLSRKEMFESTATNWPITTRVKTGAKKDGTVIAQEVEIFEEEGAFLNGWFDGRMAGSAAVCVYDIPNVAMDTYGVNTNKSPVGAFRGLGCPQVEFAIENQLNRLADKLEISPVDIRLKNVLHKGEQNAYGEVLTSIGISGCLEAVAGAIGLKTPPVQQPGPWRRGKGVAMGGKQNTPLGRAEAEVRVHSDGSVEVRYGADENGMGAATVMAQIAAEEFKIPAESIKVIQGDTTETPYDNYSASSRTVYTTGNAVLLAAQDAIAQLKEEAARILGVAARSVEIAGGKAFVKGSATKEVALPDLFQPFAMFGGQQQWGLKKGTPVRGRGVFAPAPAQLWDANGRSPRMWNWYQYSACGVELEVNEETGQIRVLKAAVANDMGNPMNPALCVGQMEGGFMMALGFAVNEEYLYDEKGAPTMASLMDYRVPTALDMPPSADLKTFFAPDPLPDGPYGAKGIAESGTIAIGPAVAAAVHQAVGVWPTVMPMTAERILQLIKEKEQQRV